MAVSLKASKQGLEIIDRARKLKGWTATAIAWCDAAKISRSTLKRFRERKPILQDAFISICQAVGVDNWQEIVEGNSQKKSAQAEANETQIIASDKLSGSVKNKKLDKSQRSHYGKTLLSNPSLTLYAFHLRSSINCGPNQVVEEAPQLWERLAELGELLQIEPLQHLRQKLICYRGSRYYSKMEDLQEIEQLTLLQDGTNGFYFPVPSQLQGQNLEGLLCPFRLHDSYAIDLTIFSEDTLRLEQLNCLNPEYFMLPSAIQASLGQTLFLFAKPSGNGHSYQALADACIAQLIPESEHKFIEFIAEGRVLGNPIFEYESLHKIQAKRLHIIVCFECKNIDPEPIDYFSENIFYTFWTRHKILYVYEQSRLCTNEAKLLFAKIEQYWSNKNFQSISQEVATEYVNHLMYLEEHQATIEVNEQNYIALIEELKKLPDSNWSFLDKFLSLIHGKFYKQIQVDLRSLQLHKERLKHLLTIAIIMLFELWRMI